MLFWWICGGESVLPVLLLRHLGSSPRYHLNLLSLISNPNPDSWFPIHKVFLDHSKPIFLCFLTYCLCLGILHYLSCYKCVSLLKLLLLKMVMIISWYKSILELTAFYLSSWCIRSIFYNFIHMLCIFSGNWISRGIEMGNHHFLLNFLK